MHQEIEDDEFTLVRENNYEKFKSVFEGKTNKNKKRKAKREKNFDDYYEFRAKRAGDSDLEEDSQEELSDQESETANFEIDEERLNDQEYLRKRKAKLQKSFQSMIKRQKLV